MSIKFFTNIFLIMSTMWTLFSCTNEEPSFKKAPILESLPTEVRGNVKDFVRGNNIEGFKIVVEKSWKNVTTGSEGSEIVASGFTDKDGNYSIKFNHIKKSYQKDITYGFEFYFFFNMSDRFNTNYYYNFPHNLYENSIIKGQVNTINFEATKLIELKITTTVLNNNNGPLSIYYSSPSKIKYDPNKVMLQNTTHVSSLLARPDQDLEIKYSYFTTVNGERVRHDKSFPYHPTLDDVNHLSFTVDCSTF